MKCFYKPFLYLFILFVQPVSNDVFAQKASFQSAFPTDVQRYWLGAEYWANRLQDWQIRNGRIECLNSSMGLRTVHLLTREIVDKKGEANLSVKTGWLTEAKGISTNAFSGFLIGAGGTLDYRARSLVQLGSGENGGLVAGVNGAGELVFLDNTDSLKALEATIVKHTKDASFEASSGKQLQLRIIPHNGSYTLTLFLFNTGNKKLLQQATLKNIPDKRLIGNIALVSHVSVTLNSPTHWFSDWQAWGSKIEAHDERAYGPILHAQYTLHNRLLKLTAQLPPLAKTDPQQVQLEISEIGKNTWKPASTASLAVPGWTATFRIPEWDDKKDYDYRLIYKLLQSNGRQKAYTFSGIIRHNPVDKAEIKVAALSCIDHSWDSFRKYFHFTEELLWFPHAQMVTHLQRQQPDLVVHLGDQIYEGIPTGVDNSNELNSMLDYLYKWYLWCWTYKDLTRNVPTIVMTDDHDVYHGNLWGAGGVRTRSVPEEGKLPEDYLEPQTKRPYTNFWVHDGGGYKMPHAFVNLVERTQTSHLPDPADTIKTPAGIGTYYTSLNYGGISFAILEDRKFKSAPSIALPGAQVVNGFSQKKWEGKQLDNPQAQLYGERQMQFISNWVNDWKDTWMKVALSQTILANVTTYPDTFKTDEGARKLTALPQNIIPTHYRLARDMDSNGWPQTARNNALREFRRGHTFMIGGDQHLSSIVHHGIDAWDDAGYSFCVPAVSNYFPRRWFPPQPGQNHQRGMPAYTGSYLDGFDNHITVWAVANPYQANQYPAALHDNAPGYGIIKLNKSTQEITMESWPRFADPLDPQAKQHMGWPRKITVEDNYRQKPLAYLPLFSTTGLERPPVVQVIDETSGEIVYTIRALSDQYRPRIFKEGKYTVKIGEPGTNKMKTFKQVAADASGQTTIVVNF